MPEIDVNNTTINYRFDGPEQGELVMLSNSLASDYSMWDAQVPALVSAGYRVLRYDSRGHGRSGVPEGPYSIEMLAGDALGLLDELGLDKVHFCGLSKGGMIGQFIGAGHAGRLLSLSLSSTSAYLGPRWIWDGFIETAQNNGMKGVVDATIDRWFTKTGQTRLPAEVEKFRGLILNTPIKGFCACCAAIRDMDLRDSISSISTRTLVLVGEKDPGTPLSESEIIHKRIAPSVLSVISDAAHLVNVEKPDIFNDVLIKFIGNSGQQQDF